MAKPIPPSPNHRDQVLAYCQTLQLRLTADQLDAALGRAERERLSYLEFLHAVLEPPAQQRRERRIARRISDARFREPQTLASFDWEFNAAAIDRSQIEELATADFVRRRDNIVIAGQSGVGKSHMIQALGQAACVHDYRVCYITSADLLRDLTASLADQTLPHRVRHYARFDLLIIDEFGFDRIERTQAPQAANLLYKVIDARNRKRSTALVTNIDFDDWGDYLGDPPLAMALLDRLVDGAIILKIQGKSYRAHRARPAKGTAKKSK